MNLWKIEVPLDEDPFKVAENVNVFVVEYKDGLILIDTGPDTEIARCKIENFLKEKGFSFSDIKKIFLTHQHSDHSGNLSLFSEITKADVFIPEGLEFIFENPLKVMEKKEKKFYYDSLKEGFTEEEAKKVSSYFSYLKERFSPVKNIVPVSNNQTISFGECEFKFLVLPGHSLSSLCIFDIKNKILFSGDVFVKDGFLSGYYFSDLEREDREKSIFFLLSSIVRLMELKPKKILPGHGSEISDFENVYRLNLRLLNFHKNKILKLLKERPYSPAELFKILFPQFKPHQVVMTFGLVLQIIDFLEEEGKVVIKEKDGKIFCKLKGG